MHWRNQQPACAAPALCAIAVASACAPSLLFLACNECFPHICMMVSDFACANFNLSLRARSLDKWLTHVDPPSRITYYLHMFTCAARTASASTEHGRRQNAVRYLVPYDKKGCAEDMLSQRGQGAGSHVPAGRVARTSGRPRSPHTQQHKLNQQQHRSSR